MADAKAPEKDTAPKADDKELSPDERLPEAVGLRRRTADSGDPHIAWTAQKGRAGEAFPTADDSTPTHFHPKELPDPEAAMRAGFIPQVMPAGLVDPNHVTMPPSGNYDVDHPKRDEHRVALEDRQDGVLEDGPKFFAAAKAQQELDK